jgi:two-component system, OmpR family, sensor histidine kinase KdpD
LLEERGFLSAAQGELLATIHEQAERLDRLLTNLLDMARLESGSVKIRREWQSINEVVGASLQRLAGRTITTDVRPDLPLVEIDAVLMEQVLVNVLENALN